MSRLIAIWGGPNCGRTTLAVKLALSIYVRYATTVAVLHCDRRTPVLPVLFPNAKAGELRSVTEVFRKASFTQDDVLAGITTVKDKRNLGFLGWMDGENQNTCPAFDEAQAEAFLRELFGITEIVVVDCLSPLDDPLSFAAIQRADVIVRLASPDLKSMSYFTSQLPLLTDPKYRLGGQFCGLNCTDFGLPVEEVKRKLGNIRFVLPYSRAIREQTNYGALLERLPHKAFTTVLDDVADRVLAYEPGE